MAAPASPDFSASKTINPSRSVAGDICVPPDKSLSHRAVLLGSIARGQTIIHNFLRAEDCLSTLNAMRMLGVNALEREAGLVEIEGAGLHGLREPSGIIDCGNSGTTMRLLMGLLAAQSFSSCLTGDQYLRKRPMDRVIRPLRQMGARLGGRNGDRLAPIEIEAGDLKPISYDSPVASAQVKSAVLLAGLYCNGTTTVREPYKSRDHTERMLHRFGADIRVGELTASVIGPARLNGQRLIVPGDISSAAFFLAAAALLPDSEILIRNTGLNPTRAGIMDVLRRMGGEVQGADREDNGLDEPAGDILIRGGRRLKSIRISSADIPRLIDEIPVITVLALKAEGSTEIKGAAELRVKETDRIAALANNLKILGASIVERPDGMIVEGPQRLRGGTVDSYGDHRIAMAMAVAALVAEEPVTITDTACVSTSFPNFFKTLDSVVVPHR
ncbi:MAG: 3-phosphoshikimate 1-carboxyvinyltransferase [Candidatus Abyssobacteria bacterium SURF_5]|uniref:3-phosphoshikimate 1-carboxyvinyltransferase n=1 Tax=Abyssobacteria bacterium (strain SURF_5) TaxID=2093360 RepID=A0A3A4NXS9_ABYX5|nr:MAG: 3-phosphoshikimate 1-carboxyvinyltransferase [Candidatus Abyssubacteria bacterium SURF_5]